MVHYCRIVPFNVGHFSFYNVTLGPQGTTDSPPPPGSLRTRALIGPALLMTDSFLISLSFLLLVLFPQKLLADLPFWDVLEELSFNLSSSNASTHLPFQTCHFSQVSRIFPCPVEGFPSYFPLWFFFLGYPKYRPFAHELLLSEPFGSLLHHCVLEDISVLRFLCFSIRLLSCLNPTLAALHVLGISGLVLSIGLSLVLWSRRARPFSFVSSTPFLMLLPMGLAQCAISLGLVSSFF